MAPFYNGKKNDNFAPPHQKFIAVIGERDKFDPIYNYQYDNAKISDNNYTANGDRKGFQKLNENRKGINNNNTSNIPTRSSCGPAHNWWANRLDEVKASEKAEKEIKYKNSSLAGNTFYGKKKVDYEEIVPNKRSYLEEFNVIKYYPCLFSI